MLRNSRHPLNVSESVSNIHTIVEELKNSGEDIARETSAIASVNSELTQILSRFKLNS